MNKRPRVGLGVLLFNQADQILLGQRKGSHGERDWGTPGGHLEFEESFEECAIREVLEETGVKINAPEFLAITNVFFQTEQRHYVSIFMRAYCKGQDVKNCEPHKVEMWRWFSLNKLPDNLFLPLQQLLSGKFYGNFKELVPSGRRKTRVSSL